MRPGEGKRFPSQVAATYEDAVLKRLPGGDVVFNSCRFNVKTGLIVCLLLPGTIVGCVAFTEWSRHGAESFRGHIGSWIAGLICPALLISYFILRWRRITLCAETLTHQTIWRGGIRTSRRFRWEDVEKIGLIDWDHLECGLNLGLRSGRVVYLPVGTWPQEPEALLSEAFENAPVPDRIRAVFSAGLEGRRAFVDHRDPIPAEAIVPKNLPGRVLENFAQRLVVRIGAGASKQEMVRADAAGLEVESTAIGAKRRCLLGPIASVQFDSLGDSPSGRMCIEVSSEDGTVLKFGEKLHGASANWLQARLASIWGLKWMPVQEGSKWGRYLSPARYMKEAQERSE